MDGSNDNDAAKGNRRSRASDKLKKALSPEAEARKTNKPSGRSAHSEITISGDGNIVGSNNTIHNYNGAPQQNVTVIVKTGDGVIDAQQKGELKRLVAETVETEKQLKKVPRSYGAVWGSLLKYVGKLMGGPPLNKYDEIPSIHYESARKYLSKKLGTLRNMRSAPNKLAGWRNTCLAAIWSEARKYPDGVAAVRAYAEKRFGTPSLSELDDKQLATLRSHVRGWGRRVSR